MPAKYLSKLEESFYALNECSLLAIKSVQCKKEKYSINDKKEILIKIIITLNDKNYDSDSISESFIKIQNNVLIDCVPLFVSKDSNKSQQLSNICFDRFINKVMEITKYYHSLIEIVFKL